MIDKLLESRLSDLARSAQRGIPSATAFLTPEERSDAEEFLRRSHYRYAVSGGYFDAERSLIVLLPDYLESEYVNWDDFFVPIAILTSGYVDLSHRSYLGSLIALGIDRSAMGDILQFPFGAVVFVLPSIADFLLDSPSPLIRVGADKVRVCTCDQPPVTRDVIAEYQRKYELFTDVVASPRLDCAVSSFARTSREKAKNMILADQVCINHRIVNHPDATVSEGDVLSIRGTGKFCIVSLKLTLKERIRIEAKRYV